MKKLLIIGTLFLLLGMIAAPIAFASSIDESEEGANAGTANQPLLIVEIITSGYGYKITITNIGDEPATNLCITIYLSGWIFVGGHSVFNPTDQLDPGETITVSAPGLVFGIGPVEITVTVTYDGMIEPASDSIEGFMLGPFFFIRN